jgi:hypothetical protein
MAASASGATEVGEVLRVGASLLADTLTASHAAVFEHHEAAGVLQCRVGVLNGVLASDSGAALLRLPTGRESMPGYTLLAGRTVVTTDLLADRRFVALAPAPRCVRPVGRERTAGLARSLVGRPGCLRA